MTRKFQGTAFREIGAPRVASKRILIGSKWVDADTIIMPHYEMAQCILH